MAEGGLGVAVLAAGASRRFGEADKLLAPFCGHPLGERVCRAIPREAFGAHWVIAARAGHSCEASWRAHGFDVVVNTRAGEGIGASVALAASMAIGTSCSGLIIALADMPLVPRAHYAALAKRGAAMGPSGLLASRSIETSTPPVFFGSDHFQRLSQLGGDTGARALLEEGEAMDCPPEWLIDIDTPEALASLSLAISSAKR